MSKTATDKLINELLSIEAYAEMLRKKCYSARASLEGVHSPASLGKKKKARVNAEILRIVAKRRATINKHTTPP